MNKKTERFYIEWKAGLENYLSGYVFDGQKIRKHRHIYRTLRKYLDDLLAGELKEENKIIILPGIRGVGKTTLLSQLYFFEKFPSATRGGSDVPADALDERFYISADRLVSDGISLQDFVRYLESVVWGDLTKNEKKILLLIDEIQYDDRWDLFLKLLFDKTKGNDNILVVATGSSAIFLNQKNKDLVRRSKSERVLPEKFTEYLSLHRGFSPPEELSAALREAFFAAADAREVFEKIHSLRSEAVSFLSSVKDLSQAEEDYFLRGSFPFSAEMTSVSQALERIKNMILVNIIQRDLVLSGNFDAETLVKIPDILFLLANSDEVSTGNLANTLKLHSNTVNKILKSLVDAEILYEINPYGQPYKRIRKSAKYLFVGPAVRSGLLSGVFAADIKGKLPEDCAALIFTTDLYEKANVFYDYGKGGADFILRFSDNSEVVLEIGLGKGEITQVEKTLKKTAGRARYGLVIGAQELELVGEKIVKIPLEYFLLA